MLGNFGFDTLVEKMSRRVAGRTSRRGALGRLGTVLAGVALAFGPHEYFSLMVLGLVASVVLASGSLLHAFGMILFGLILGLIGTDTNSGEMRYTFGMFELADGISFVIVAMGVFGLGEILSNLENENDRSTVMAKITGLMPTRDDFRRMMAPVLRGTAIGSGDCSCQWACLYFS